MSSPVATFGGLNLVDDPEEIGARGAVDLSNVDLDRQGRVRTRDGSIKLTADLGLTLTNVAPFYKNDGTRQLIASSFNNHSAVNGTTGAIISSTATSTNITQADYARFGGPGAEVIYATGWHYLAGAVLTATVQKWSGAVWANAAGIALGGVAPYLLEVKAQDNRLVGAFSTSQNSRIGFSDAGVPETWTAANFIDLTPGDGESIKALVSWRDFVFVFKETKFFVFTATSTTGTGTPLFNYRSVDSGVGCLGPYAAVATPKGVYFLSRRGIYLTTGGDPVLVSRVVDPIFRGGETGLYSGSIVDHSQVEGNILLWHDERLYFAYITGAVAATPDRMLVYDPERGTWLLWRITLLHMTSFRSGDKAEIIYGLTRDLYRISESYTTDNGTAIAASYRSGWFSLADDARSSRLRGVALRGIGTPTVSIYSDYGTTDTNAAAVTLGTDPTVARGLHQKSYDGRVFSFKLSSTSGAWEVDTITLNQYP